MQMNSEAFMRTALPIFAFQLQLLALAAIGASLFYIAVYS